MLFRLALLLSSKGEAEMILNHPGLVSIGGTPQYRLSIFFNISQYGFGVQRASYPDKGQGKPVYLEVYHVRSFETLDKLEEHLKSHDLNLEGWSPVENDEDLE